MMVGSWTSWAGSRSAEFSFPLASSGNGRGWKYTVESVNRWLDKIPESVRRLDLEGLQDPQRQQAIDQWYAEEQQALQAQTPAPEGEALTLLQKQLDALEQQRTILQKDL